MNDLTRDEVAALLTYDPETGVFRWKVDRGQRVKVGDIAGTEFNGYRRIRIKGRAFKAHRLAFLLMTGAMPSDQVDHINGQKDDNRCPLMGGQASVHRIDDLQSYTLGSLEWATKAVQATEKGAEPAKPAAPSAPAAKQ